MNNNVIEIANLKTLKEKKNPLISVIIPVYNVEKYVTECLESVISQTFKDIEIICIDDCGQDNSMNIVSDYAQKDNRIKIIKHSENKGLGPARNTGINAALGKYIIFLDSDDYFEAGILEKLYNKIILTKADFVMVNYYNWYSEYSEKVFDNLSVIQVTKNNIDKILNNFCMVAWGKLFKSKYLKDNNLFFIDTHDIHEDDGFTIKVLSTYPSYSCIEDRGVMYRCNSASIMSTKTKEKSLCNKKNSIDDAINYIYTYSSDADYLVNKIKFSYRYSKIYYKWCKLFRFIWEKYDKHLIVFFIDIFKAKISNDVLKVKFLGITIFQTKIRRKYV